MRTGTVVLVLMLAGTASADDWISLQPPDSDIKPQVSVDAASVRILADGTRQARWRADLHRAASVVEWSRNRVSYVIWTESFDCDRRLSRPERDEFHMAGGETYVHDTPQAAWRAAGGSQAEPAFAWVCAWHP